MSMRKTSGQEKAHLTGRDRELICLIADGSRNKDIAAALGVTVRAAEARRAALMRKYGFDSVVDLVRYAVRHHLIEP
jgi:DNA-binding NarL/FixJ family response regulator